MFEGCSTDLSAPTSIIIIADSKNFTALNIHNQPQQPISPSYFWEELSSWLTMGLAVLACLCLLSLLRDHVTGLSTDPFVENGGTVVLPAPANASNVSIICNVTFQGTPFATHWYLTVNGGTRTSGLDMNDPNFQLSGGSLVPILTIVSFGQDLDMAVLECINNGL